MRRQYFTAGIATVLAIIAFISETMNGKYTYGISGILVILLSVLMIAAFKRPSIPLASVLAAIGALGANAYIALIIPDWITGALSPSVISPATADGIKIGVYCCGFIYAVYDAFCSAVKVIEMREENFDKQHQSAAVSRDVDEKTGFMVNYLRPDQTYFILMIATFVLVGIVYIYLLTGGSGAGREDSMFYVAAAGIVAAVCIYTALLIHSRRKYRSYIRQLSDSGELSRMAEDFFHGTRYWENEIVLGEHYIFAKSRKTVCKYSDIAKIYQRWSNINTMRQSPWWYLRTVTIDGRDLALAKVPYRHSDENFVEFVLPVILEIRSRNPQIVIEK